MTRAWRSSSCFNLFILVFERGLISIFVATLQLRDVSPYVFEFFGITFFYELIYVHVYVNTFHLVREKLQAHKFPLSQMTGNGGGRQGTSCLSP
jgi:hypothetical protein